MAATLSYFPFDAGPGSESRENRWEAMMQYMRTTGVIIPWDHTTLNPSTDDLAVTANGGLSVQTAVGNAWVHGFMFQQTGDYYSIPISPNSSGDDRIDLLTARLDTDANTIVYHVEEGTPAMSPVAPTPVESAPIWDLSLAEIYVADGAVTILSGDITDTRVISVQGAGGSSAVTLASAGGTTLVNDGTGPDLAVKGLTAGPNITLTPSGTAITIEATGAGSSVTLANAGTTSLVNDGVGPALATKGLIAGTNVTFGTSATDVTINADTVTLTNAGTTSLVNDGTGQALATKGLVAGTNISFSTSATDVTITGANAPSNSPVCFVYKNATTTGLTDGSTTTISFDTSILNPNTMWDSMTNPSRITISDAGVYLITALTGWVGVALANGPVELQILLNGATILTRSRILIVGADTLYLNCEIFYSLSATDYLTLAVVNNSGQTLSLTSSTNGPKLQAIKIRS